MTILCITMLPKAKVQPIPAESGTTFKPSPVTENVAVFLVAPMITIVSTDSNIEVSVFYFLYFFFEN